MSGCFTLGTILLVVKIPLLNLFGVYMESFTVFPCMYITFLFSYYQLASSKGYGLSICWYALVGFQWVSATFPSSTCKFLFTPNGTTFFELIYLKTFQARFCLALSRLLSPDGILYSENPSPHKLEKLEAV